jgi:hypothetical protein
MKRMLLIWMLGMIFLMSSIVQADIDLTDGLIRYYKFDETSGTNALNSVNNLYNGTLINNVILNREGKINKGFLFNHSASSYVNLSTTGILTGASPLTLSSWVNVTGNGDTGTYKRIVGYGQHATGNKEITSYYYNDKIGCNTYNEDLSATISLNQWYHVICTYDGTNMSLYINGQLNATKTFTLNIVLGNFRIGTNPTSGNEYFQGIIDEVAIYNRSLNSTEIALLYDIQKDGNETGQYPFTFGITPPTLTSNLSSYSNVKDNFNVQLNITNNNATYSCTVLSSNANISCTTEDITLATNTTDIVCSFSLTDTEQTTTLTPSCTGDYNFNATTKVINIDLLAPRVETNINNSYVTEYTDFLWSVADISPVNWSIVDSCNGTTTNDYNGTASFTDQSYPLNYSIITLNCSLGSHSINITVCDSVSQCTTENYNFNAMARLNVTAVQKLNTSLSISNFSIYQDGGLLGNTTTGVFLINNLTAGDYNITIIAPDYEFNSTIVTITDTYHSLRYELLPFNTINVTFRDEKDNSIINFRNITFELISENYAQNYSTQNGTLWITNLNSGFYSARYKSVEDTYPERFYYFNLINGTFDNIILYSLNSSLGDEITVTVIDQNSNRLEDAYIEILRYDITTNSYKLVEVAKTNFNGQTIVRMEKNSEFYYFIVEYPFNTQVLTTSPTYIYSDSVTLQAILGAAVGESFENRGQIIYNLSYNYNTNNFRFAFNDPNNLVTTACLRVYKINALSETLYNETCINSASGLILIGVDNSTGNSYKAQCFVSMSPESYLDTIWVSFKDNVDFGSLGVFMIIIMVILFATIGVWSPVAAVILTPIPITFGAYFNMIEITFTSCIALHIISFIIAFILMINKK